MEIKMNRNDTELIIAVEGRLDTLTAPDLEEALEAEIEGVEKLIFDFGELKYISSAGLRVLLTAMQIMADQGEMTVKNVTPDVMDVFEVTGFVDDLNIE